MSAVLMDYVSFPLALCISNIIDNNREIRYSGPPLIRTPLGNGKSGLIRGMASREGNVKYYSGLIRELPLTIGRPPICNHHRVPGY